MKWRTLERAGVVLILLAFAADAFGLRDWFATTPLGRSGEIPQLWDVVVGVWVLMTYP